MPALGEPDPRVKRGHAFQQIDVIWIALAVTMVAAVCLRFSMLTTQSYWMDELFSAGVSKPWNSFSAMWRATLADVHPPLYQSLLWLWYKQFGFTEYAGRALSAAIGSLGILALFFLGKECYCRRVGLYAAIIASANYFLLYYSQEVRSYGLLFLFATLSYLAFLKFLRTLSGPALLAYLLVTVALVYTHYYGIVLVATQGVVLAYDLARRAEGRGKVVAAAVLAVVVIGTSLLPILTSIAVAAARQTTWIEAPRPWFVVTYLRMYVASRYLCMLFSVCGLFAVIGLVRNGSRDPARTVSISLGLWLVASYGLPYLRSITAAPVLTARNTIIAVPAIILLVSYGIHTLGKASRIVAVLCLVVVLSAHSLWATGYHKPGLKQQWREVLLGVSGRGPALPVYAFHGTLYRVYGELLGLDLTVHDVSLLRSQLARGDAPRCFWLLDGDGTSARSLATGPVGASLHTVERVVEKSAEGILFSQGPGESECRD